jgi:hypothetical protein
LDLNAASVDSLDSVAVRSCDLETTVLTGGARSRADSTTESASWLVVPTRTDSGFITPTMVADPKVRRFLSRSSFKIQAVTSSVSDDRTACGECDRRYNQFIMRPIMNAVANINSWSQIRERQFTGRESMRQGQPYLRG